MTSADIRAKAETLMIELGESREYYARDTGNKYALQATQEAYEELTAFVDALIECAGALPIIAEWADAGRHEEDFSAIAKKAKAALSRLEELTK